MCSNLGPAPRTSPNNATQQFHEAPSGASVVFGRVSVSLSRGVPRYDGGRDSRLRDDRLLSVLLSYFFLKKKTERDTGHGPVRRGLSAPAQHPTCHDTFSPGGPPIPVSSTPDPTTSGRLWDRGHDPTRSRPSDSADPTRSRPPDDGDPGSRCASALDPGMTLWYSWVEPHHRSVYANKTM